MGTLINLVVLVVLVAAGCFIALNAAGVVFGSGSVVVEAVRRFRAGLVGKETIAQRDERLRREYSAWRLAHPEEARKADAEYGSL